MRFSPGNIANGLAWLALSGLAALCLVIVRRLGFPGVLLIGLATTFVCSHAELDEEGGASRYDALMRARRSPEERAAAAEARERAATPLRYYRGCGLVLVAAGLLGTAWQIWH